MGAQGDPLAYRQDGECLFLSLMKCPFNFSPYFIGLWILYYFVLCMFMYFVFVRKIHFCCKFCATKLFRETLFVQCNLIHKNLKYIRIKKFLYLILFSPSANLSVPPSRVVTILILVSEIFPIVAFFSDIANGKD